MKDKVALITGGASGLGRTITVTLAKQGCQVIILYHTNDKKAIELQREIKEKYQVQARIIKCDLSSEQEINKMIEQIKQQNIKINYLVNNAALCIDSLFEDKTKENFMKTLEVNVVGTFLVSRLVGNMMYENRNGTIVNISSTNGINQYFPMSIDYDASKAALNSLTHNLALQFSPYVRVNAVAPGWVKTENEMRGLDDLYIKSEEEKIFIKRFAEEQEIANIIIFLLSDQSSYINNQIIEADGGMYS
ncbi:MAG: SDR family oxidoreductase [Bacilli bacterium]|nr:SDR family oxidoreductase [Bacilli bacterium]